ncbi:MAG: ABC transporter ATP-binding protein [Phycisphaeraceae bacterium]|nr:ABC transporter ATP-binding protein [Phycisphaeraceae bacterium]
MPTAIGIHGITKVFGSGQSAATAVDNISLAIEPGELFFLLGPSGCGKTTLLRMIAGFIEPTSGKLLFDGRDVTRLPPNKRNTGMVFQSYALWPHMTVEANVAFGLSIRKVAAAERDRRVAEGLSAVRMSEYAKRKPNQLSGGQQQRVALARALVIRPDVLLLDEPLSNLDAKLRIELRSEIRRICKESGITTVYVTHDQKEALSMADRIAIIDRGRIVQLGPPAELYRKPGSRFVAEFLGETNFLKAHFDGARLQTAAGPLTPAVPPTAPGEYLVSVRPEAIRLATAEINATSGTISESLYLGELAHHTVLLPGGASVQVAEVNPSGRLPQGQRVDLHIEPADVIVISPH